MQTPVFQENENQGKGVEGGGVTLAFKERGDCGWSTGFAAGTE